MRPEPPSRARPGGFTLAAVMVILAAILLLSVGVLAVVGIERKTARSYLDAKRAEWIARAGVEEVRTLLRDETLDDDFLIVARPAEEDAETTTEPLDYLYLARGEGGGEQVRYRLTPLFSTGSDPAEVSDLQNLPDPATLVGEDVESFRTFPWADAARTAWIPVENDANQVVGRYAFWVEDLQARVGLGGDEDLDPDDFAREPWPHPAPGVKPDPEGPPVELALHAFDPEAGDDPEATELDERLVEGRPLMISPDSALAAAGFEAPLERGEDGRLLDAAADTVERGVAPRVRAYEERPLVPHARGIDGALAGEPKLNLNDLLAKPRDQAIEDFKNQIEAGLPDFEDRKGAFPDDYLGTLAAGAFDYADEDGDATLGAGIRGIDGFPLLSEIFLHIHYRGLELDDDGKYLTWTVRLFAEVWNMTDKPVAGDIQLSYENGLSTTGIGALPQGLRFDDPRLMLDPAQTTHTLSQEDGRFWSQPVAIALEPDQYETREFATIDYRIYVSPRSGPGSVFITSFALTEPLGAAGVSMRWNGDEVDRVDRIVRYAVGDTGSDFRFEATRQKYVTKAAISGHSYGPYGDFINNMGDPRISNYIRSMTYPLGLNAYPDNASPNRRNIRRGTIYDRDSSRKLKAYGRVLPSEWPDGGHDSMVGSWRTSGNDATFPTNPALIGNPPTPEATYAPHRLSNLGRFYSATELGRVFDPVMWWPTYPDLPNRPGSGAQDTRSLAPRPPQRGGILPTRRDRWPEVSIAADPSAVHGGGNTLRIGRPEHERFRDEEGLRAAHLLDLFHAGKSRSEDEAEREGPLVMIDGKANVNTATPAALRSLAAGLLAQDPQLSQVLSPSHRPAPQMAAFTRPMELGAPERDELADYIVNALIESRPFASAAELAEARTRAPDGTADQPVFGNRDFHDLGDRVRWNDAAAEEVFARIYEGTTLRSRNFRVWVVGQALAARPAGTAGEPEVLAESRKVFSVFADPGERDANGEIDPATYRPIITHENDF
ncbi:hypothetical protein [Haloferula sp. A504]|uniref:hypothetical protein n=1 Tax=Haloferula sp. A504 TaxID=3373601 RepID=UPI0031C3A2A9|nr:hypothetical protein [Verrucomicrobiaceae bacterium E54]